MNSSSPLSVISKSLLITTFLLLEQITWKAWQGDKEDRYWGRVEADLS